MWLIIEAVKITARQISQDEEAAQMLRTMWVSMWASTVAGQYTNQTSYGLTAHDPLQSNTENPKRPLNKDTL